MPCISTVVKRVTFADKENKFPEWITHLEYIASELSPLQETSTHRFWQLSCSLALIMHEKPRWKKANVSFLCKPLVGLMFLKRLAYTLQVGSWKHLFCDICKIFAMRVEA